MGGLLKLMQDLEKFKGKRVKVLVRIGGVMEEGTFYFALVYPFTDLRERHSKLFDLSPLLAGKQKSMYWYQLRDVYATIELYIYQNPRKPLVLQTPFWFPGMVVGMDIRE